jgi:hypothetical protein
MGAMSGASKVDSGREVAKARCFMATRFGLPAGQICMLICMGVGLALRRTGGAGAAAGRFGHCGRPSSDRRAAAMKDGELGLPRPTWARRSADADSVCLPAGRASPRCMERRAGERQRGVRFSGRGDKVGSYTHGRGSRQLIYYMWNPIHRAVRGSEI